MSREAKARKRLVLDPEEAQVVRDIYDLYLAGLGGKAIAERLNQDGRLYRGKRWSQNRVLDILGDEAYVGRYYFNKRQARTLQAKPREEWVLINVEPIVDEPTWLRARPSGASAGPTGLVTTPPWPGPRPSSPAWPSAASAEPR